MPKSPSSIPQELFSLIPADEKGCSINYNRPRDVYYVYRWLGTTYDPKRHRGIDRRESIGAIRNGKFEYSKNYLTKKRLESLQGKPYKPTKDELSGKQQLDNAIATVEDPRMQGKILYRLDIILLVSVLSALSGGNSAVSIALYWKHHRAQLEELIEGFPKKDISHDTINRVFRIVKRQHLEGLVEKLANPLVVRIARRLLHADGQSVRASRSDGKTCAKSFLNVYDSTNGIVLTHQELDEKENEIPASQEIFEELEVEGAVVTVDALNTQKNFAKLLIEKKADYCLAVKENHKKLYDTIRALFNEEETVRKSVKSIDCQHGRIEERTVRVMSPRLLGKRLLSQWPGLENGSIVAARTKTEVKRNDDREKKPKREETRYFISSISYKNADVVKDLGEIIRKHWSVENNLHWTLDTSFNQDRIQVKDGNYLAARVTLNKVAFNLLSKKREAIMENGGQRYSMDSLKNLCQSPADAIETVYTLLGRNAR